jgi:PAS domain S-box-containing protein
MEGLVMAEALRKTGISVVGDLPWGAHFCYFYETKQDLLDILIPYFKTGLENKEFCLWVISNSELLTVEEAKSELRNALPDLDRYMAERSIEVVGHDDWFLSGNTFDPHTVANRFRKKLNEALARGYAGMRVNGSPAWLHDAGPQELRKFEAELDKLFPNERTIASCTYPIATIGADEIFDVARTHQFAIARRHGEWEVLETPELIQAKQEIQRLNDELEQRVVERTRELATANEELKREIAERQQAEDALRGSEDRLRLVIDTVPALIHTGLPDGQLDFFNQRWLDFVGLSLEDLSGWKWTAAIHPEDVAAMVERWRAALVTGEPYEHEARVRRADGEYHWMVHREVPLRDERGNIVKWYASSIDIEDRKRAEDALRQSEDHLRLVIDTIPTMAWSVRPDGVVDFLNQRWLDYAGLSLEQSVEDPTGPIHPDDVPRVMEKWRAQMTIGEGYEDEVRLRRADGEYRWFLVLAKPLRDAQGDVVKWYGSSIDIEDRKQAEEKLKHSKVQLAQAQRLAHIGSWDWDLRTNAVTWSDELYHIFGLQPGTINVAGEVDRFIHPDDLDLGWDTVKRAVASKEPYDYYHRILRPDGTERIARSRGSIMSDERGEPIKVFGATQDVTELKRAEAKLKATTEQLRALSANLQSAREEESKRIAREIHDELGGALTSWRWDLEEIRDTISEPLDSSQVAALQTKIEAMIKLTTTTLDIVRRLSSELRPMALDELGLVEAIEWQALQFQTRTGIAVEYEYSQEKVDLNSEQSTAVFRILQEALTNVLRHTQATKVTITVKQESGEFFLAIKDNGRGIAESEKSGAHSLGLLGMRERAHLIGAQIDITGIEGKGTAVSVRIPISESSERQKKSLRADNDS